MLSRGAFFAMVVTSLFASVLSLAPRPAAAANCSADFNPASDIVWDCIFPIRIAGVTISGSNDDPVNEAGTVCICPGWPFPRVGIAVSYWEPSHLIDTNSDPYCYMPVGQKSTGNGFTLQGGYQAESDGEKKAFSQFHLYKFPAWAIMGMFLDTLCHKDSYFDVAFISEYVTSWQDGLTASFLHPEAAMFGNVAASMACAADSIAALVGPPIDALFWCMGSWASPYPFSGSISATDYVEANAGLAARGIYMMHRTSLMQDKATWVCASTATPIWIKSHYRLQLALPVRDYACRTIGRDGILWSHLKNPIAAGDNFMWVLFRKVNCCVSYE